jgi:hypothetical protein
MFHGAASGVVSITKLVSERLVKNAWERAAKRPHDKCRVGHAQSA